MKRSNNIAWSQVKGGALIVFALIFLAGGILLLGEKTKLFVPKGRVSVIMTDVAGLKVGAPVWLAGVDVGIVAAIQFERPKSSNEVEVVLEVEQESLKKIGRDSIITVKTRGLLGEKYVDVTPSKFVTEVPETRLYGTPVVQLDAVLQKAGNAFDRLNAMVGEMGGQEGTLGRLATDPKLYDNMVKLTGELEKFTRAVNNGEGSLGKLARYDEPYNRLLKVLTRADETLKDIQSDKGTLGKFIHDPKLYDKLVAVADKSEKATNELRELNRKLMSEEGSIGKLINDTELYDRGLALVARLDASTKAFEETVSAVNRGEGTAGRLVKERELYDRMNSVVDDIDALVKDIKENPKRYIKFSLF